MKDVFNKINEIEKKAQIIAGEAEVAEKNFPDTLKNAFAAIDGEYEQKLKRHLEQKTADENKRADAEIEKIAEQSGKSISELKACFEKNAKNWEEEIFRNIIK